MRSRGCVLLALAVLATGSACLASPAASAEAFRASLASAQLYAGFDPTRATEELDAAASAWASLRPDLEVPESEIAAMQDRFAAARRAIEAGDTRVLADLRGSMWTDVLAAGMRATLAAIDAEQPGRALELLGVHEYRRATRVTTPGAEATAALLGMQKVELDGSDARTAVTSDLLDAYQARLLATLHDLAAAVDAGQAVRGAELHALARGYFDLLAQPYAAQRGEEALRAARDAFAVAPAGAVLNAAQVGRMLATLDGFRAAPLSPEARNRRAAQLFRYLSLVPVEYARGVSADGGAVRVTNDLEISEARAFLAGARGSYDDLEPLLFQLDAEVVPGLRSRLAEVEAALAATSPPQATVVSADAMQASIDALQDALTSVVPAAWRKTSAAGDVQVISDQLRALRRAVASEQFDLAESTRLDAYAILESGPEARLRVFRPELSNRLEQLFWNGTEPMGLARAIRERAPLDAVDETIAALDSGLSEAASYLRADAAPAAVALNAGIIVFREGLEAVLILAALLGSLKRPEVRHFRRPLWAGAGVALLATVATWFVLRGVLTEFARYGEKLEAVVSVVALIVLLLIMNWFFHQVYWTDHLAGFHKRKQGLLGGSRTFGLALLGLSAIYREGFETVLFLQSLVLQSSAAPVARGILVGFCATVAIGAVVFVVQTKLPYKKMLIATGVMVCLVVTFMAGNTVHVLQLVGWFPVHPLPFALPTALGVWTGTYATYEGVVAQAVAVVLVVGSYFAAERLKRRGRRGMRAAAPKPVA